MRPLELSQHYGIERFKCALNWDPIMPRDASLGQQIQVFPVSSPSSSKFEVQRTAITSYPWKLNPVFLLFYQTSKFGHIVTLKDVFI